MARAMILAALLLSAPAAAQLLAQDSTTSADLWDIWGASELDQYAVGAGGTILHYDGVRWEQMASPTSSDLLSIWGSSAGVFATGGDNTLLQLTGDGWSDISEFIDDRFTNFAVWSGGGSVLVGGRFRLSPTFPNMPRLLPPGGADMWWESPPGLQGFSIQGIWGLEDGSMVFSTSDFATLASWDGNFDVEPPGDTGRLGRWVVEVQGQRAGRLWGIDHGDGTAELYVMETPAAFGDPSVFHYLWDGDSLTLDQVFSLPPFGVMDAVDVWSDGDTVFATGADGSGGGLVVAADESDGVFSVVGTAGGPMTGITGYGSDQVYAVGAGGSILGPASDRWQWTNACMTGLWYTQDCGGSENWRDPDVAGMPEKAPPGEDPGFDEVVLIDGSLTLAEQSAAVRTVDATNGMLTLEQELAVLAARFDDLTLVDVGGSRGVLSTHAGRAMVEGSFRNQGGLVDVVQGSVVFAGGGVHEAGDYQVAEGAELVFDDRTGDPTPAEFTALADMTVSGAGTTRLVGGGLFAAPGATVTFTNGLQIEGGELGVASDGIDTGLFVLQGDSVWSGGTISGPGAAPAPLAASGAPLFATRQGEQLPRLVRNDGFLSIREDEPKTLLLGTLANMGTVNQMADLTLDGAQVLSSGSWRIFESVTIGQGPTFAGSAFINEGLLQIGTDVDNVVAQFEVPLASQAGTTLRFRGGSTLFLNAGSTLGGGTVETVQDSGQLILGGGDASHDFIGDFTLTGTATTLDVLETTVNLGSGVTLRVDGTTTIGNNANAGPTIQGEGLLSTVDGMWFTGKVGNLTLGSAGSYQIGSVNNTGSHRPRLTGTLTSLGTLEQKSEFQVQAGARVINFGSWTMRDHVLSVDASGDPAAGGVFENRGMLELGSSDLMMTASLDNHGTLKIGMLTKLALSSDFTNQGTGKVEFDSDAKLSVAGKIDNFGVIDLGPKLTAFNELTATQLILHDVATCALQGHGTVHAAVTDLRGDCDMRAGNSPGTLSFDGDLITGDGSTIELEIGGTVADSEHDLYEVTGTATLANVFAVSFIDADPTDAEDGVFHPEDGDVFDVLVAGEILDLGVDILIASGAPGLTGFDMEVVDLGDGREALRLTANVIPEPATALLLAGGLVALGARRRQGARP